MISTDLNWRSFATLSSDAEAASCSALCLFSFGTLEVARHAGESCYALTERRDPSLWRWVVIDEGGKVVDEGCKPTQGGAKEASAQALKMAALQV